MASPVGNFLLDGVSLLQQTQQLHFLGGTESREELLAEVVAVLVHQQIGESHSFFHSVHQELHQFVLILGDLGSLAGSGGQQFLEVLGSLLGQDHVDELFSTVVGLHENLNGRRLAIFVNFKA